MRSDRSALSTVQDALGLGGSMVDVAYTAVNTSIDLVDQIKTKLVAAREPGIDRTKVQSEISELQKQLAGIASSASFSGDNWLSVDSSVSTYNASKNIVASFTRTGNAVSVQTITIDTSGMDLFDANTAATNAAAGILDANRNTLGVVDNTATTFSVASLCISALTDSTADLATLDSYIKGADAAIKEMTTAAGSLGAVKKRIGLQKDFVTNLISALDRGIGSLVDADMNEEFHQAAGPAGQAAAGHPGAEHRQRPEPEHSQALPVDQYGRRPAPSSGGARALTAPLSEPDYPGVSAVLP